MPFFLDRAGADAVYAAEVSLHMCDVGEEATITNGYLGKMLCGYLRLLQSTCVPRCLCSGLTVPGKVTMLDRDARRLDTSRHPDGIPPDLPRRADLLVYEVCAIGSLLHAALLIPLHSFFVPADLAVKN